MKLSSEKLVEKCAYYELLSANALSKTTKKRKLAIIKQAQTQYPPELVKELQRDLNILGFGNGNLALDGKMGTETQAALNSFYKWKNVPVDPSTPFDAIVANVKAFADKKLKHNDEQNFPPHHTRH